MENHYENYIIFNQYGHVQNTNISLHEEKITLFTRK